MSAIKLNKRHKSAGDVFAELIKRSGWTIEEVNSFLNSIPDADVVEVVRCKNCEYCEDTGMSGLWCNHPDNRNPLGC